MELKDFIKEAVQSIVDATIELQLENRTKNSTINPALSSTGADTESVWFEGQLLPVTHVAFDIAVTEEKEKSGGGGSKIRIASFELGGEGKMSSSNSTISRIAFNFRLALPGIKSESRKY